MTSTPAGFGVGPDHDDGSTADDLYLFSTTLSGVGNFPTSGSFVLVVPGANMANYNVGTYTNNPNVRITVTNDPYDPVPEPSTFALMGAGLAAAAFLRRRK